MNVLLCHNFYQQPGGEDRVFADETSLLQSRGCRVETFIVHNDSIKQRSKLTVAGDTVWNRQIARTIGERVRRGRFDIVHFHNTFPLISPASWYAAREAGAAVVQTLHNFRLLCPQGTFLRDGRICTECVGRQTAWPAMRHRCYRNSLSATTVLTGMLAIHRRLGTFRKAVDCYIALTQFAADMFIRSGLPAERVRVKPNFMPTVPAVGDGAGSYALYVGRLSEEKGIDVLVKAWQRPEVRTPLWIIGDGPLAARVRSLAEARPNVRWLGSQNAEAVQQAMQRALCLLLPSTCYEGMPKTLVESLAVGTPIVASRLGPFVEMVDAAQVGRLFQPGNAAELAAAVDSLAAAPDELKRLRAAARAQFEQHYTPERNWDQLMNIYDDALACRRSSCPTTRELLVREAC